MVMTKIDDFWKKKVFDIFLKIWKLNGFDQNLLTITPETAKHAEKKYKVFIESFMLLQSHSPCMLVFSSMLEEKKLSHMEAQKLKS